jgi:hypothetical protein
MSATQNHNRSRAEPVLPLRLPLEDADPVPIATLLRTIDQGVSDPRSERFVRRCRAFFYKERILRKVVVVVGRWIAGGE